VPKVGIDRAAIVVLAWQWISLSRFSSIAARCVVEFRCAGRMPRLVQPLAAGLLRQA
jgi:hypothetical protein